MNWEVYRAVEDKDYSAARNRLIPLAINRANKLAGPERKGSAEEYQAWKNDWDARYLDAMKSLSALHGIQGGPDVL
jgi:hypothetical protein